MKIDDEIESIINLQNNAPIDDFFGLSATDMHHLLYDPLGDKSVIKFRDDIDDKTLDQIPLFLIVEDFLKILQREQQVKLTPAGLLPKKLLIELYDKRYLLDEHIEKGITKLYTETNCIAIMSARLATQLSGLVKKVNGRLSLTKATIKLMEINNRVQIFKQFFLGFTNKFRWSYNDGFPEPQTGQFGWAFSLYMLYKLGDKNESVKLYAEKYLNAFPMLLSGFQPDYNTPENQFIHCYGTRTFDRFFLWLGFVTKEIPRNNINKENGSYKATGIVRDIFILDE